jgi:pimeloyl-ACP methyl ester carboxylesterase
MSTALTQTADVRLRSFIHKQHASYFSGFAANRVALEAYAAARSGNVLDYCEYLPEQLLIVAGERDLIAPVGGQEMLAKLTAGELRLIPKVGHLTHYEKPVEVAEHLAEFLER